MWTATLAVLAILCAEVALSATSHADRTRHPRGRTRPRATTADAAPPSSPSTAASASGALDAGVAPPSQSASPATPRSTARSAFELGAASGSLRVVARRAAGVLVGDSAVALTPPWPRGGTWTATSLARGTAATYAAPLRIVPSGRVGVLADNLWPAGDVLVAYDGTGVRLLRADGTSTRGAARAQASLLGVASVGAQVVVWWRLDATRTELEALDGASARTLWTRAGPPWAWDTTLTAAAGRVALLSGGELSIVDAVAGTPVWHLALGPLLSGVGWPHPFALGGATLVVASPGGALLIDPATGARRSSPTGAYGLPSLIVADARKAFLSQGEELVGLDLATGAVDWTVRVASARSLRLASSHVVLCDIDGGVIVVDRASGTALVRVGVGGCDDARERADGTLAVAGARETWLIGPAPATTAGAGSAPRARVVDGVVTLDGAPTAGLPVLIGAGSYPLDGADGCPPLPAYAQCMLTDAAGRFRATVRALGLLPVVVDLDAAAHRARRPRAEGGHALLDLDAAAPPSVRLDVVGADEQL